VLDESSRRQMVSHRRAPFRGHQREADGQGRRREPMTVVHQPAPEDVSRQGGLQSEHVPRL
jgi:hypothetical protein